MNTTGSLGRSAGATQFLNEVSGGARATRVVPEKRVPHDVSFGIECNHAVLLTTDSDSLGALEERSGCVFECVEPGLRVDLGSIGVRCAAFLDDLAAFGLNEERFGGLGRGVDP